MPAALCSRMIVRLFIVMLAPAPFAAALADDSARAGRFDHRDAESSLLFSTSGIAVGACCLLDGTCLDGQVDSTCLSQGGVYQGDETSCDSSFCPACTLDSRNEPNCGFPDLLNGGCNSVPFLFEDVFCGSVICATTQFNGVQRDLDWYHWDIPQTASGRIHTQIVLDNLTGRSMALILRRYNPASPNFPCGSDSSGADYRAIYGVTEAPTGAHLFNHTVSAAAPVTEYTLIATFSTQDPNIPAPLACSPYRLRLLCALTCDVACSPSAVMEMEPDCGAGGETTTGCSQTPAGAFRDIDCGTPICGATRLVLLPPTDATRDLDWYRITTTQSGNLEVCLRAEFFALVGVQPLSGPNGCNDPDLGFFVVTPDCGAPVCIDYGAVPAGSYAVLIAADFGSIAVFDGVEIGCGGAFGSYELTVNAACGAACGACGDANCDGVVSPGDIAAFVAAVTGGEAGWTSWHLTNLGAPPTCDFLCANDTNNDGLVTPGDIAAFVARLTSGTPCD